MAEPGCGDSQPKSTASADPNARQVNCVKFGKELPGLDYKPMGGELGQRIYDSVSAEAWDLWVEHSKMLINEYRLSMIDPKAREMLKAECEKFFFGEGSQLPPDYTPPARK